MAGHVVVDGSNIATEGRSFPSLAQLDEAVRAFIAEHPHDVVTVVVDASFGHRIDSSEHQAFEDARAAGELVMPPAGAIGRGDAFLLQIADKANATVLSNDSFQEFHGQYDWLFDEGRLVGGTPVAGVGWIFSVRTPVRGPRSREAMRRVRTAKPPPAPATAGDTPTPTPRRRRGTRARATGDVDVEATADDATGDDTTGEGGARRRRRRRAKAPSEPVNDPATFVAFVADHLPGAEVDGTVDEFSSHGAYVTAAGARCYVPLSGLGDPPPRSARQVVSLGETRSFVVRAIDTPRRGIELALPGVAPVPQPQAELDAVIGADDRPRRRGRRGHGPAKTKTSAEKAPAEKAPPKRVAAGKARVEKASAKTAAPRRGTPRKPAPDEATAEKAGAEKAPLKKTAIAKKAPAKTATAKKAGPTRTTKAATAKKAPAKTPTAKKAGTAKTPAKKATTATKRASANKAPAKKATAKKAPAKKATKKTGR